MSCGSDAGGDCPPLPQGSPRGQPSPHGPSLPAAAEQPVPTSALSRELRPRSATALFLFLLFLLAAMFPSSRALQAAGAGGTLSYQPQRDGGKRKEEAGRARSAGAATLPARAVAVPSSRARRKAWTMGGKEKAQRQPQAGQHKPPRWQPQKLWCQQNCRGPLPVTAAPGIRARPQTATGASKHRMGTWLTPQRKHSRAWICPPGGHLRHAGLVSAGKHRGSP